MVQKPLLGQGPLIVEASRLHSDTPHAVGLIRTIERTIAGTSTWHHPTLTNTRVPRWIRTQNPSKRKAADPHPRPPGHWDRLCAGTARKFCTRRVLDPYRLVGIHFHTTISYLSLPILCSWSFRLHLHTVICNRIAGCMFSTLNQLGTNSVGYSQML